MPGSLRSLLVVLLALVPPPAPAPAAPQEAETPYVCPPCGAECHFRTYPGAGSCGGCGMALVPLTSVPQIGILLHPDVDLASSLTLLGVLSASNAVRAFSVADTDEPLRVGDALEVRPQFALADAPPLDLLVVPQGFGAWDDPLIVDWVRARAESARLVLAVGRGSVLLAKAGLLEGARVPGDRFLAQHGKELAPEVDFDASLRLERVDRFLLARDLGAGLEASFTALAELVGPQRARETAERLGLPWDPPAEQGR